MRCIEATRNRRAALGMVCLLWALGVHAGVTGCSSTDDLDQSSQTNDDAASGTAATDTGADSAGDSSPSDDGSASADDGEFLDAGAPLVVTCAQKPCATKLTATFATFCALLDTGHVACWGQNSSYQLGRGIDAGKSSSYVPGEVLEVESAIDIRGTCAILQGGTVKCWGLGNLLQTDDGGRIPDRGDQAPTAVTLPIPPARSVSISNDFSSTGGCAALLSGEMTCWGFSTPSYPPLFIDAASTPYADYAGVTVAFPAGHGPVEVAVGIAAFARDEAGVVTSWGDRRALGRASSLVFDPYPLPIALEGVTAMSVAGSRACAVAKGKVYCWGPVPDGALTLALPERVLLDEPAVAVATAPGGATNPFACAVTAKHDLWCWGANNGQLGDGTKGTLVLAPVKVTLPGPVASASATANGTCALLESGQVYCWGADFQSLTPKLMVMP